MTEQLALTDIGAPPPKLTPNQQAVWDLVRTTQGGVTRDQAGALVHSLKEGRWSHPATERCDFCARDGRQALRAQALKPLVVGKRDGRWYPRNPADAVRPATQRTEPSEAELHANPFAGL